MVHRTRSRSFCLIFRHHYPVTILIRPHVINRKYSYPVTLLQRLLQIGSQPRDVTEDSIDKEVTLFLISDPQARQQIGLFGMVRKLDFHLCNKLSASFVCN